jgi:hypothetical protein
MSKALRKEFPSTFNGGDYLLGLKDSDSTTWNAMEISTPAFTTTASNPGSLSAC